MLTQVIEQIAQALVSTSEPLIITIDGPAGSGKTTLAKKIARNFDDAPIVHMDSLYAGWDNALSADLWHRLKHIVVTPWLREKTATFEAYNWHESSFSNVETVHTHQLLIIEGVGASHPSIRELAALSIWVEAPQHLLLNRVLNRDGIHIRDHMLAWQTAEQQYFDEHDIATQSDVSYLGIDAE